MIHQCMHQIQYLRNDKLIIKNPQQLQCKSAFLYRYSIHFYKQPGVSNSWQNSKSGVSFIQKSKLEGVSILLISIYVGIFRCELGCELRCECEYFIITLFKKPPFTSETNNRTYLLLESMTPFKKYTRFKSMYIYYTSFLATFLCSIE